MDFFQLICFGVLLITCYEINKGAKEKNTARVVANIFFAIILSLFFAAL